jgi:hypothetical protein
MGGLLVRVSERAAMMTDKTREALAAARHYVLAATNSESYVQRKQASLTLTKIDAALAALQQEVPAEPVGLPPNTCLVRFVGIDPLDPAHYASLPMIPDSWRFGFNANNNGDGSGMTFGLRDDGEYVAYEAVRELITAAEPAQQQEGAR